MKPLQIHLKIHSDIRQTNQYRMCAAHCCFIAALRATAEAPQQDEEEAGRASGPPPPSKSSCLAHLITQINTPKSVLRPAGLQVPLFYCRTNIKPAAHLEIRGPKQSRKKLKHHILWDAKVVPVRLVNFCRRCGKPYVSLLFIQQLQKV